MGDPDALKDIRQAMQGEHPLIVSFRAVWPHLTQWEGSKEIKFLRYLQSLEEDVAEDRELEERELRRAGEEAAEGSPNEAGGPNPFADWGSGHPDLQQQPEETAWEQPFIHSQAVVVDIADAVNYERYTPRPPSPERYRSEENDHGSHRRHRRHKHRERSRSRRRDYSGSSASSEYERRRRHRRHRDRAERLWEPITSCRSPRRHAAATPTAPPAAAVALPTLQLELCNQRPLPQEELGLTQRI